MPLPLARGAVFLAYNGGGHAQAHPHRHYPRVVAGVGEANESGQHGFTKKNAQDATLWYWEAQKANFASIPEGALFS